MDKNVMPPRSVPTYIRRHLLDQKNSSQTIKEYCRKKGISHHTFYAWRKYYGKRLLTGKNEVTVKQISFTELGTLNTQGEIPHRCLFDIRFPGGTSINVYPGTTAVQLAPFIELMMGGNAVC